MRRQSGFIWTVCCASNSVSPTRGRSYGPMGPIVSSIPLRFFFFLIAGCIGSLGYWQSLATRELNKQHQRYCVPKESQVPIHYDLSHHNLCMTERMVHRREKRHNNTRKTKARKHQPPTKTNTHNQTQNHRQHRGETVKTTLERCGPFSLVVLSQRRSQVTPLSGHSDQNASETFSNKLQLNKVQSSLRQTSAKTTQVRSKAKTS